MDQIPAVILDKRWGVNPSYLTPAHLSNFRPAYKKKLVEESRRISERKD